MRRDWELFRIFLEVARAGTLRKASLGLNLSQPTIGKHMDRLEEAVGAKLIFRTRNGTQLTPLGERLLPIAEEMERLMYRVSSDIEKKDALSGRLRIAMSDGMAGYWLVPHLRTFHQTHPHVTLDVQVIDANSAVDLSRREADITIVYVYPDDPDVVVLQKSSLVLVPVCTEHFVNTWGKPASLGEVIRYPVCAHTMHYRKEGSMKPWAEMLERHPMVTYRTGSSLVLADVARMGIGISLQPIGVFDRKDVFVLIDIGFRCELPFFLVCHREVKDVPIVRAMLEHLSKSLFRDDGPSKT
jgi:DNA-binding transcriptional LysR family regulator